MHGEVKVVGSRRLSSEVRGGRLSFSSSFAAAWGDMWQIFLFLFSFAAA
jgi:hypothetical protein